MTMLVLILGLLYGVFVLYMDIFHWDWLSEHQHRKLFSIYDTIENKWGEKGVRIVIGLIAVLAIALFIRAIFDVI